MSCPKTDHLLQEYFNDDLPDLAKRELESHLDSCSDCQLQLNELLSVQADLRRWDDQRVPHWDRGMELYLREHHLPKQHARTQGSRWSWAWQWLPTASSFAMLALLLFNTSVVADGDGMRISFGGQGGGDAAGGQALATVRDEFRQEMDRLVARMETRQDANNLQLMQVVVEQAQQATAVNLDRIYTAFEQQRQQDLEAIRVSVQELMDSDFATMQSLQQLAMQVSYDSAVR